MKKILQEAQATDSNLNAQPVAAKDKSHTDPVCGMALEPMDATAQADDSELKEMTLRFWLSFVVSVPLDGEVTDGHSNIDESMITGEPLAVEKKLGDKVSAGTVNQTGAFILRANSVGADTLLSRIVKIVNDAGRSRAPIQKLADQVSSWFVPTVIIVAILAFAIWAIFGSSPALANGLVAAVSVLIIACPCATLVVDKTGTLTEGKPKVQSVVAVAGANKNDVLKFAASLDALSEHPLAIAIVNHAKEQNISLETIEQF